MVQDFEQEIFGMILFVDSFKESENAHEFIKKYADFLSCYLYSEILTSDFGILSEKTKCV